MKKIFTLVVLSVAFYTTIFAQAPVTRAEIEAQLKANGLNVPTSKLEQVTKAANTIVTEKTAEAKKDATDITEKKVEAVKDNAEKKVEAAVKNEIQTEVDKGLKEGKTEKEAVVEAVEKVTDKTPLKSSSVYGHHLYRTKNISSITNGADVKASDNYELGIGDEISINVWGRAEFSGVFKIGDEGYIKIEKMPRLYLKGMKYGQAKQKISSTIGSQYNLSTSQIAISLNYSRVISVNIVGEVMEPRTYTLSALNTAVNALAAAEGPSDLGSVRRIQLQRAGKPNRVLDLYKFLLNPMSSEEFFIENGDYIFVPTIGKIVEIQGAVKRPFKYELLPNENLKALLEWSGGVNSNAITSSIQIRRFENERTRIMTISLDEIQKTGGDFKLQDGDILSIASVDGGNPVSTKEVLIQGAVEKPTTYNILMNEGLRVLIGRAGGLKPNANKSDVQVRRYKNDLVQIINVDINKLEKDSTDFLLERGDAVVIATIDGGNVEDSKSIAIKGAISKPGTYNLLLNEGLRVLIGRAGGILPNTYTGNFQIQRIENNETKLYDVSLKELDSLRQDFPLKKGDIVTMNAIDPDYFTNFGEILGAVKLPGRYQIEAGKTRISDFLKKAELREDANTPLVYLSRVQKDLSRLYFRISLDEVIENPASSENMLLQSKDELFILSKSILRESFSINVLGAVRSPGEQRYTVNTNLRDAIFRAGGLTFDADHKKIEISRVIIKQGEPVKTIVKIIEIADTLYIKNDSIANFKLQPFDQISVRRMPGFELQRYITLNGEVKYPGTYAITSSKERLADVIKRAGGLTEIAAPKDATLVRTQDNVGFVILDLKNALTHKSSYYNYLLKAGDVITIPKARELVSVEGAVDYPGIEQVGRISMTYRPNRGLQYYIQEYAGGLNKEKRGSYYHTQVRYPNGAVKKTKRILWVFNDHPKIQPGCVISVGVKPLEQKDAKDPNSTQSKNNDDVIETTMKVFQFAVSALTVILLASKI